MKKKEYKSGQISSLLISNDGWKLWWKETTWEIVEYNISADPFTISTDPFTNHGPGTTVLLRASGGNEEVELRVANDYTITLTKEVDEFPKLATGDLLIGKKNEFFIVIAPDKDNDPNLMRLDQENVWVSHSKLSWYHNNKKYGPLTPLWADYEKTRLRGLNFFRKNADVKAGPLR